MCSLSRRAIVLMMLLLLREYLNRGEDNES